MGASLCKPRVKKRITTSSWISNENDNPFEKSFTKKERICLRETYQRLTDPKEIMGIIFVDIVNDLCPELKKLFGVDRAPKVSMLKLPKLGGHVSRMTDFLEQMTTMIGFTENLVGAWQLVRKTGRLHAKIGFLEENQNQLSKNYFAIINDYLVDHFIPYVSGEKPEPNATEASEEEKKKKLRYSTNYSTVTITNVWVRFFAVCTAQMTEAFELERQKCLNADNQKTLAPHQQAEENERKRRLNVERQNELAANPIIETQRPKEEMFEDPF